MTRIFYFLLCIILLSSTPSFAGSTTGSSKTPCLMSDEEYFYFLGLDYAHFDQDSADGWRLVADKECYLLSAELIIRYIAAHPKLEEWQRGNLYFHAGQLYAFDNRPTAAVHVLRKAHHEVPATFPVHWNAYVDATIAFLNKNAYALKQNRELMAQSVNGQTDPNLYIVENMIKYFYKPYAYVYKK